MKRYLIAALVIFSFSNSSFAEDITQSPVANVENAVFRSSLTDLVPDEDGNSYSGYDSYSFDDNGRTYKEIDPDNMPFFKQMRLRATNAIINIGSDSEYEISDDGSLETNVDRFKFWKRNLLKNLQKKRLFLIVKVH